MPEGNGLYERDTARRAMVPSRNQMQVTGVETARWRADHLDDEQLVREAKGGDVKAYEELVRRHQTVALRAAALIAGPDAPDAVQDAFVKAYAALGRFRADAPFRPWLLRIVANEARNARRAAGRRGNLAARLAAEPASRDAAPSPEAALLSDEETEALYGALLRLGERDRLVLGYRFLLGLSERETAAALEIRPGTVKSRTVRGLARLRVLLAEEATA